VTVEGDGDGAEEEDGDGDWARAGLVMEPASSSRSPPMLVVDVVVEGRILFFFE
jgi:hypothetical protein